MMQERPEEPSVLRDIPLIGTESFVVRIYRRGKKDSPEVVGLVQSVETQDERAFRSLDELMDIFRPAPGSLGASGRSRHQAGVSEHRKGLSG